ncbi:MAG: protein-glutamate O-methyltransferase CheR [Candidatus Polarisedimenticolaceae bacterium]|nr:protein-glutamate O-methyltransferase CheR [Candidatus Polarisedimenticolaceae bacterium]
MNHAAATRTPLVCSAEDYTAFKQFLCKTSGIELGDGKEYLVISRLNGLMRQYKLANIKELLTKLTTGHNPGLKADVIDAMTTNETFWFRDAPHFRLLTAKIFPEAGHQRFRIWSAACSSGQEPYSISMQAHDYRMRNPGKLRDVEIISTDISASILNEARRGVYSALSASRGLDDKQRSRYFIPHPEGYEVKPEIKKQIHFQEFNLTRDFASLGRFDVIFCRNVLIYFPPAVKQDIIQRMSRVLRPGGYLFLGSTESMPAGLDVFEMITEQGGIIYRVKRQ